MDMHATYRRAENFLPWNLDNLVFNSTIFPYWSDEAVYYFRRDTSEASLIRIDINNGSKEILITAQLLLESIAEFTDSEVDPAHLILDKFSIKENPKQVQFYYQNRRLIYNFDNNKCVEEKEEKLSRLISPNKKWSLLIKNYNLFLMNLDTSQDFQLTTDGEKYYDYASSPETNTRTVSEHLEGVVPNPVGIWSPASDKIVTHKLDQRKVSSLYLLQNSPENKQRPVLHAYRMSFAGDTNIPLEELIIIHADNKKTIHVKTEPLLAPFLTPIELKWIWWTKRVKTYIFCVKQEVQNN